MRERKCPSCHQLYYAEFPLCPVCSDPHAITGECYEKQSIMNAFVRYLKKEGIRAEELSLEDLENMLEAYPKAYNLFKSNGTYRTVNIPTGTEFEGRYGTFTVMEVCDIPINRYVMCNRCEEKACFPRQEILDFFLGFRRKHCLACDASRRAKDEGNLNRNGRPRSETSERSLAKALNVSRNDYRRYKPTLPVPALPVGTEINGMTVTEAYWDDTTLTPKYRLYCPKCNQKFTCIQKRISTIFHYCNDNSNKSEGRGET